MGNATLILIVSGLIAFVPNDARHPSLMTAYLLKVPGTAPHKARLRVPLSSFLLSNPLDDALQKCRAAGCAGVPVKAPEDCDCSLVDATISFDPGPAQSRGYMRTGPFDVLPSGANALHLSWMSRLANVGGTNALGESGLEEGSAARVSFGWTSATTCAFDEEINGNQRKVFSFGFRPVGGAQDSHAQAVAELAVFRSSLSRHRLTIRIVDRSGDPTRELRLECKDGVCPVAISNRAEAYEDCESCEDERCAIGRHFSHYYSLLRNPPPLAERAVPHRRCDRYVTLSRAPFEECPDLFGIDEKNLKPWERLLAEELAELNGRRAVSNRVICPMAILDP